MAASRRALRALTKLSRTLHGLAVHPERFPGALLLTGPSQARLEEVARRLAAGLLCPGDDPEGRCDACRRVASLLHPDLMVVAPEGVQIRIDRVRDALAFGAGRPYESQRRVAVVSRAELLGPEAANALLKSLEEPGAHFHWILTTNRPEMLLPTIRSRCVAAPVAEPPRTERLAAWRARGFSEPDAEDMILAAGQQEEERAPERLEGFRQRRTEILRALEEGLSRRQVGSLLLLAETLSRADSKEAALLAEILADAAVAAETPADLLRHRTAAGAIRELSRRRPADALRRAALKAADAPPDSRRGNRRLHYESVLLELYLSA